MCIDFGILMGFVIFVYGKVIGIIEWNVVCMIVGSKFWIIIYFCWRG